MFSVGHGLQRRENNFDLIRLLAALTVLVSHSYPLTGVRWEPFAHLFTYDTGGGFAVAVFFVLSGLLVTRSAMEHDPATYLVARVLRIVPALAVVTLVEYLVVGPLFTTLPIGAYLKQGLSHLWNPSLFWMNLSLPGVFVDLANPMVNGSLWTLPIEAACYLWLLLLVGLGIMTRGGVLILTAIVLLLLMTAHHTGLSFDNQGGILQAGVPLFSGLKCLSFFLVGSCFYVLRDRIPLSWALVVVALIILKVSANGVMAPLAYHLCVPYLAVFFGLCGLPAVRLRKTIGEMSYGVYIYAFPVQQMVVSSFGPEIGPLRLMLLSMPPVLLLAWLSWHWVEKPALRLKAIRSDEKPALPMERTSDAGPARDPIANTAA